MSEVVLSRRGFLKTCSLTTLMLAFPAITPSIEAQPVMEKAKLYRWVVKSQVYAYIVLEDVGF
jgi:hypothetical protein